jgi:hypothetical protein
MSPREKAQTAGAPAESRAPGTTAVRAKENFPWHHRRGPVLTFYRAGQFIPPGPEADELLRENRKAVAIVGEEPTATCAVCSADLSAATIRGGDLIADHAHVAMAPIRMTVNHPNGGAGTHVSIEPGGIVEILWEPRTARRIVDGAAGAVRRTGIAVFRVKCARCGGSGFYPVEQP